MKLRTENNKEIFETKNYLSEKVDIFPKKTYRWPMGHENIQHPSLSDESKSKPL